MKLYTWTTGNGRKISIALEEMGLSYEVCPVDIHQGEQHTPEFIAVNPNNKIPALEDNGTVIWESGAILLYLANKTRKFCPEVGSAEYFEVLQWLMWQVGGFGPMLGQAHHFLYTHPGKSAYSADRYAKVTRRLYGVLDRQLEGREHVVNDLSIADFAIWPWAARHERHFIDLNDYPNVKEWYSRLAERPAFVKGWKEPKDAGPIPLPKSA